MEYLNYLFIQNNILIIPKCDLQNGALTCWVDSNRGKPVQPDIRSTRELESE